MSGHLGCKTRKTKLILELHSKGMTIEEILSEVRKSYPTSSRESVYIRIYRNGLKCPLKKQRYCFLNEKYFEKIDTQRTAYFFGLICADGGVSTTRNCIRLALKYEDGYLIHELKKELECTYKIGVYKPKLGGYQQSLVVYSEKMASDLLSHGCGDRKSLTLKFPNIDNIFIGSFLRGYFDGDGWLYEATRDGKKYKNFGLIGSNEFCASVRDVLLTGFGIKSLLYQPKNKKYSTIMIVRQSEVFKIRELLYEHDSVSLKRKKDKFYSSYPENIYSVGKTIEVEW